MGSVAGMTRLRVLTYNLRSMRSDGAAVVRVIRDARADVVCVQEAPKWFRWRARCAALARESGMVLVSGGIGSGNNILMCDIKIDVRQTRDILLTRKTGLHQRGVSSAVCRLAGAEFLVATVHLDLDADERRKHVDELLERLSWSAAPLILGGDVNEQPAEPAFAELARRLVDVAAATGTGDQGTSNQLHANRRIDGLFVDQRISPVACRAIDSDDVRIASDHRPVVADLDLP